MKKIIYEPAEQDKDSPALDSATMEELAEMCKGLAHPARVAILAYLKSVDRCICGDIVDFLPLAQSTVSQHLKKLKQAGLVQGEVEGPRTCYCIDHEAWERFQALLAAL